MSRIDLGKTDDGRTIPLLLSRSNRHGLITGSTGSGKTTTMQTLIEGFSAAGVPVFAADIKGDLSGVAAMGDPESALARRSAELGIAFDPAKFPTTLWDVYGEHGHPIRTSIQEIGADLLGSMLNLNSTQAGALAIAFRKSEDEQRFMMTLDDLRWTLNDMLEERDDTSRTYGNITSSSITTIQRNLLALESMGGAFLFGEPPFNILDLMRTDEAGRGVVNLLHADRLMYAPKVYATLLLWMLSELFKALPEVGDLDKPKLVFFFDEAHLLFADAPANLLQQIERLVRLVRSKGVGVFFVTQSPGDIPDSVLAQLGNRVQHVLRAYTPKDQRMIKAAVQAFRENRAVPVKELITTMGVGEALVSVLDEAGIPIKVEKVKVIPPSAQVGPISPIERAALIESSPIRTRYGALKGAEAVISFNRRMRKMRGLSEVEATATDEYTPGLYKQFLPDFDADDRNERRAQILAKAKRDGKHALMAIAVAVPLFYALSNGWL